MGRRGLRRHLKRVSRRRGLGNSSDSDPLLTVETQQSSGELGFLATTMSVPENFATTYAVVRRNGSPSGPITATITATNGTATSGTHYTLVTNSISWTDGDSSTKYVYFNISQFSGVSKEFSLSVSSTTNGVTISPTHGTIDVTITQVPGSAGTTAFYFNEWQAQESTTIQLKVKRFAGSVGAVSVDYETIDGTAIAGVDYVYASGTINWANGVSFLTAIPVTINAVSGDKIFYVELSNPTGDLYLHSAGDLATVTIYDYVASAGQLAVTNTVMAQGESSTLTINVARLSGSAGVVGCSYATANNTAVAGTHYTSSSGTLSWANGNTDLKNFTVPLLAVNANLTFTAILSSPTGGATLHPFALGTSVTILNSDGSEAIPLSIVIDHFVVSGLDALEDIDMTYTSQDSHVIFCQGISNGKIGFNGGTASYRHGLDMLNDDSGLNSTIEPRNKFQTFVVANG